MCTEFKVGDRVRVVRPEHTFGDYEVGSVAIVLMIAGERDLWVDWEAPHYHDFRDNSRTDLLFASEVELIEEVPA